MSWAIDDFPWWCRFIFWIMSLWRHITVTLIGGGLIWLLIWLF